VDVETTSAIERLTERIDKLETSVHGDLTGLRGETANLRSDITGLRGEIANLRAETREGLEEVRRHATVLNEQTNETLRVVAEGVAYLSVKIDFLSRQRNPCASLTSVASRF
jgi:predicted  nucleic acid-binding Zn-ribbon protein